MTIAQTKQLSSTTSVDTEVVAEKIGRQLKGGEVIELTSDLGGGKTTFVRGLVRGAGSPQHVSSPTFKISNEYQTTTFTIYHFDFYRLAAPGIVAQELAEIVDDTRAVIVVEWGEVVHSVLPAKRLIVTIKATGENSRELIIQCPSSLSYLLKELT